MAASENVPTEEGVRPPVVLVVEDVVLVRMLIAERLRSRGLDVVEAGDGVEAVRVLEAGLPVHAVLSDIHMPGASSTASASRGGFAPIGRASRSSSVLACTRAFPPPPPP